MQRKIKFTPTANKQYEVLENTPANAALLEQVRKAIGYLEIDPHHRNLHTYEFSRCPAQTARRSLKPTPKTTPQARIESFGATVPMKSG